MWIVQIKGDIHDLKRDYVLSVIKDDNAFGKSSWGWGGSDKIILFGTGVGGNDITRAAQGAIEFALSTAQKLADALNA